MEKGERVKLLSSEKKKEKKKGRKKLTSMWADIVVSPFEGRKGFRVPHFPFRGSSLRTNFLCICDLLVHNKSSVSFQELLMWSEFVCSEPVRALFIEGRRLYDAYKKMAGSPEGMKLQELAKKRLIARGSIEDISNFARKGKDDNDVEEENGELFTLWGTVSESLRIEVVQSINVDTVKSYLAQEDGKEIGRDLGEVFEVLGRNMESLLRGGTYTEMASGYLSEVNRNAKAQGAQGASMIAPQPLLKASVPLEVIEKVSPEVEEKVVSLKSKASNFSLSPPISADEYKKRLGELASPAVVEQLMQSMVPE